MFSTCENRFYSRLLQLFVHSSVQHLQHGHAYGSGFTLMHKARIWFMDIWLGLGLSVTDRVSVRHTPEIFVALFTSIDTRPIYKALVLFQFSNLG